ncbi:hypothetical protein [Pararhizobium sp. DWP3-4]|uniref:hypothetical protein n=1 Tax=Pararhizobium sp. DWP3-4 TaxID=2804565 RepID=UPI003CECD5C5
MTILYDEICFEPETRMSGRLIVHEDRIKVDLFSFERRGNAPFTQKRREIILSTGQIATLMNPIVKLSGTSSTMTRSVGHVEIDANYIVLGTCSWTSDDRVATIEFCLPDAKASLSYRDHVKFEHSNANGTEEDIRSFIFNKLEVARIKADDFEVVLSKRPSIRVATKDKFDDPMWITTIFKNPVELESALQIPLHIEVFFELSEGRPLQQKGLALRASNSSGLEEFSYLHDFEFYRNSSLGNYKHSAHRHTDAIFTIFSQDMREKTIYALTKWINRRREWEVTYWLISSFTHGNAIYDRGNLLRAMAWFESIPDYQMASLITESKLKNFRKECRKLQSFVDLDISPARLKEVLNELTRSPLVDRIDSAIKNIRAAYGEGILPRQFDDHCKLAKTIRNSAAHGGGDENEKDFRQIVAATSAIETLALLSTIMTLNIDLADVHGILNQYKPHPYASYCLWFLEGQRDDPVD